MYNVQEKLYATHVVYQYYLNPISLEFERNIPAFPVALVASETDAILMCEMANDSMGQEVRFYELVDNGFQSVKIDRIPLPFE